MAIKLGVPKAAYWIDLGKGVRVHVRPLSTAVYETALAASRAQMRRLRDAIDDVEEAEGVIEGLPDLTTPEGRTGYANFCFAQALGRGGIIAWEGVLGEDGEPTRVTPEAVDEVMMWHDLAESFVTQYTAPFADRIVEGNASGPSLVGTTGAGPKSAGVVH